tara:strand:- start:1629 stop:1808 length:180 start_codon:yes stop_codon:yes gene_type:complete
MKTLTTQVKIKELAGDKTNSGGSVTIISSTRSHSKWMDNMGVTDEDGREGKKGWRTKDK